MSLRTPAVEDAGTPDAPDDASSRRGEAGWHLTLTRPYPWSTISRLAEYAYVVVALAALTQGPVLTLWTRHVQPGQTSSEYAIISTYLAVQMPALALLARRGLPARGQSVAVAGVLLLAGWLSLSTVWSTLHVDTVNAVVPFVATTCFGLYLAVSFSSLELLTLIVIGMQPGLLASEWAIERLWVGSRDPNGNWVGIFFNRNSLGPPAAIAAACSLVLIAVLVTRRPKHWWLGVAALLAISVFDLRLQRHGGSATSWVTLAVFAGSWALWQFAGAFARRTRDGRLLRSARRWGVAYLSALVVVAVMGYAARNRVSSWFGRPPEFDGRGSYWRADWAGVKDRPIIGWGWLAAWHTPEFRLRLGPEVAEEIWSHSAFFDLLLGGGVIAAAIFAVTAVAGFADAAESGLSVPVIGAWPIAMATAILVAATQESFIIGNHFLWALLVASLCWYGGTRWRRNPSQARSEDLGG